MVTMVYIDRRYFVPESELMFSAQKTWGMIGFALIAFIQSMGGIFAAIQSMNLKDEDPWTKVNVNKIIVSKNKISKHEDSHSSRWVRHTA